MKEPLFRGFSKETNQWHYGFGYTINRYMDEKEDKATLYTKKATLNVELDSVGHYATIFGMQRLFSGDVLRFRPKHNSGRWSRALMIEWGGDDYPAFDLKGHMFDENLLSLVLFSGEYEVEVLGNVYENKELV